MDSAPRSPSNRFTTNVCVVVSLCLILLAVSHQSIWIDEAATATYAMKDSFRDFAATLWAEHRSEAQMPFGMWQAFVFEKVIGHSEYALRLPNVLWLGLGIIALGFVGRRFDMPWLPLLMAAHPMVWHYVDEARPYAIQIGMAAILLWASVTLLADSRIRSSALAAWWGAGIVLCASNLMAALVFAFWFVVLVYALRGRWRQITASQWAGSAAAVLLLSVLAAYYGWTVLRGTGGARLWDVGLANAAFASFELGGFMGFSPGRIAIREAGQAGAGALLNALTPYAVPLVLLALTYAACLPPLRNALRAQADRSLLLFCSAVIVLTVGGVLAICFLMQFPFWGRHLVALIPLVLFVVAVAIRAAPPRYGHALLVVLVGLLLAGSLNQRFNERHLKDDYRSAVALAKAAEREGQRVLWAANLEAAAYYNYEPEFSYWDVRAHTDWHVADVIFYSKPDIFDQYGVIAERLGEMEYVLFAELPAFTVWIRQP